MNYTEEYLASLDEAMTDRAFLDKLHDASSKEEIISLFSVEKGITLDDADAQAAIDKLEDLRNGGELSAEDLESVAGGMRIMCGLPFLSRKEFDLNVSGDGYSPRGWCGIRLAIHGWLRR